nr:sugar phosphate nucleotidyltransferase [uncultured Methanoregula sp.]
MMSGQQKVTDIVIFCGGRGTRLSEKTHEMPKPLIELGEYPILWHIMKIYSAFNHQRFVLTLGYKGEMIVDYFLNRHALQQNFSIDLQDIVQPRPIEPWKISFIQTGLESKTAKRLYLCKEFIQSDTFMATYGDGVADIDIAKLLRHHEELRKREGVIATITLTKAYSKYGIVTLKGDLVEKFSEKPLMDEYISVGFMVLEQEIFNYIDPASDVMFEDTLAAVAKDGKLGYYIHDGFWHAMDTYKDYVEMNEMWRNHPKWKIW